MTSSRESQELERLRIAARAARTEDEILKAVSAFTWNKQHSGQPLPDDRVPTAAELSRYFADCWCESSSQPKPGTSLEWATAHLRRHLGDAWQWVPNNGRLCAESHQQLHSIEAVQLLCRQKPSRDQNKDHALCYLVHGWQRDAPLVRKPNPRADRILPSGLAMVPDDHRRAGRLFSLAAHVPDGTQVLSGFETPDFRGPALPLAFYNLGVERKKPWGRGAQLPLRLFVEIMQWAGTNDRYWGIPIVYDVELGKMLNRLYPGARRSRPDLNLPRLIDACHVLDSESWFPWIDPKTGRGSLLRMVTIEARPQPPSYCVSDRIQLRVKLPPGWGPGPVVPPSLAKWGVKSAPAYRALLNLAFTWFDPGKTRIPAKGKYWVQVMDPSRYPPITDEALIQMCFPTSARRNRRTLKIKSEKTIDELVKAGDVRVVTSHRQRRILPGISYDSYSNSS